MRKVCATQRRNLKRETHALSKTDQISGFNLVTKHLENISRHASRSGLGKARRRGDRGDSSLANRLSLRGLPIQPLHVQLHNEIFHGFSPNLLHKSEFAASDSHRFGTNAVADTQATVQGASRKI